MPDFSASDSSIQFSHLNVDRARERFRQFQKGKIREDLKRYLTNSDLIGKKGNDRISIPIPDLDLPRFDYDQGQGKGVGSGDGEVGDVQQGKPGDEPGEAGENAGEHSMEMDVSIEELAQMLGEELGLPNLQPKQSDSLETQDHKYNDISRRGPDSLRHNRRTLREALLREISEGTFDPDKGILPIRDDFRFKSPKIIPRPKTNAAIIYIMDVSGSMGHEQKEIARIASFWINAWLDTQYRGCEKAFIVHDAEAKEVDEETFFNISSNGGTKISSAYLMADQIIKNRFPPDEWNIYVFQFTDGDNWGGRENDLCYQVLREQVLPYVNQFGYGQLPSGYRQGRPEFLEGLESNLDSFDNLVIADFLSKDMIPDGLKEFLSTGN